MAGLRWLGRAWLPLLAIAGHMVFAGVTTGSVCAIYSFFGLPCPGCGSTRAFLCLLDGRLSDALAWHPLLPLSLLLILLSAAAVFWRPRNLRRLSMVLAAVFLLYIGVYVCRMVWLFPHTPPMTLNRRAWVPRIIRALFG